MENLATINNEIYDTLGERWYLAQDDPVALLRAESRLSGPWVQNKIKEIYGQNPSCRVLDIGCGGGFLSNHLAQEGHKVTGVDLSLESLVVAQKYDSTGKVNYMQADAYHLPFSDSTFDVVCAMDFLEHVENPAAVISEASRVLAPGGLFFFRTFNRNLLSGLIVIKFVEWFVPNTPKQMHVLRLFVRPQEMRNYCERTSLIVKEITGTRPQLFKLSVLKGLFQRKVPEDFEFTLTPSLLLSYLGYAKKISLL